MKKKRSDFQNTLRVNGINQETQEVEWEVSLPQSRRWLLESPEFSFEGLKYRLWVYTDYLHSNLIRAQLDMQGPFIASPSRVVQWQMGVKRRDGYVPHWTERHEILAEGVYTGWRFIDKWKIFELSELQQKKEDLLPNGRLTLILQLSMVRALTLSQSLKDVETTDLHSSELLRQKRGIEHADDDLTQPEKTLPCLLNSSSRVKDLTEHQVDDLNSSTQSLQPKKSIAVHKETDNDMSSTKNSDTPSSNDSSELHQHKKKRTHADISSSDEDDLTLPDKTLCPLNSLSKVTDLTENQVDDDLNDSPQSVPHQTSTPVQKEIENYMPSMGDSDTASFKEFQKIVFQKLDTILHKINIFENKLETIENNLKRDKETEWKNESFGKSCEKDYFKQFPLRTDSAVLEIEEELHAKGIDDLVTCLRVIGGSNEQECITRILQRVLTNEIAEHYSWSGFKGNKIFKHLYLSKAIFYAAKSHFPSLTEKSTEQIVAKWLKYAKQRKQRLEEKSKKLKDD